MSSRSRANVPRANVRLAPRLVAPVALALLALARAQEEGLGVQGQATYNSSRYTRLRGGTLAETDGFVRLDLEGRYTLPWAWLRLKAGVRNALDTGYRLSAGYSAEGRTVFARLVYRFDR